MTYDAYSPRTAQRRENSGREGSNVAADQLRAFIERVERINEEKQALADDTKEIFAEAKACGFDTKAIRKIIALRKLDEADRQEQQAVLDTYLHALGMAPEPGE